MQVNLHWLAFCSILPLYLLTIYTKIVIGVMIQINIEGLENGKVF